MSLSGTTRWDHPHPEHTTGIVQCCGSADAPAAKCLTSSMSFAGTMRADDGHHYYEDPESGTTTWTKPAALAWVPMNSEEHAREYYYNTVTQVFKQQQDVNIL